MVLLLAVAFLAGLITSLSPCVLPVLPILLASGATGGGRRPYVLVAGLVASFVAVTLAGAALLDALGLPQDLLRNLGIAMLFLVAATLLWPRLAHALERPLYGLTRRRAGDGAGAFVVGLSLGVVFVPCAGPVLAAVSVLAATSEVTVRLALTMVAYAVGAALPMLAVAIGGRRVAQALRPRWLRPALGGVVAVTAVAIALGEDRRFQTFVPGYTEAFQERVERSGVASRELGRLTGVRAQGAQEEGLADYGPAPELEGLTSWINSRPSTLASLRGRVVVIDFWTYSCVNCLRTLPYLKRWDAAYRDEGLTILGVHAPEFAFERVPSNVRDAVDDLGIRYPVALDNDFRTWRAFANQYWPAKYVIDRRGNVRYAHFGEGAYAHTEDVIRTLLAEGDRAVQEPRTVVDGTGEPTYGEITPESYLGYLRIDRFAGSPLRPDRLATYTFPVAPLPAHHLALSGRWRVEGERAVAASRARLRIHFSGREANLVLSGTGTVEVLLAGHPPRTIDVDGDRLYNLLELERRVEGLLELRLSPGVAAYAFTFG
jgi:cytochrome c biogenesis protein CcdA/thiol-disulfide isomerase/thioredoxin